jgi:hypothetical protein
MRQS